MGSSNPAVEVREAEDRDLDALLHLYEQLADGQPGSMPADPRDAAAILTEIRSVSARALLVAVVGERVVGTADCMIVVNLTHAGKPWAIVENVVVDADTRRAGIGSALMEAVLERAERAGCYKVQLISRKDRPAAHAFYRSLEFEPSAEGFRRYLL
jgi:ribosomal protein S18 acetylase RimI-like enzyme